MQSYNYDELVHTNYNSIYLRNLRKNIVPSVFIEKINSLIFKGFEEIFLTIEDDFTLPHVIVPIAGYLSFLKSQNLFSNIQLESLFILKIIH